MTRSKDSFGAVLNNGALVFGSRLVMFASAFLSIRVLVQHIGISGYGTWEILTALAATCSVITGPLGGTLQWKLSGAFGKGNEVEANRFIGIGFLAVLCMALAVFIPVYLAREWIANRFHLDSSTSYVFARIAPLMVFIALAGGINEVLATVIDSNQKTGVSAVFRMIGQLIFYAISITMILMGFNLWALLCAQSGMLILNFCSFFFLAKWYFPGLRLRLIIPTIEEFIEIKNYYLLLAFGYVSAILRDQTDKLILGLFASTGLVGIYGIASRLASLVTEAATFLFSASISAAGAREARRDRKGLRQLYMDLTLAIPVFAGLIALWVVGVHRAFIFAWVGRAIPEATPLILFVVSTNLIVVSLTAAGASMCRGIGRVGLESRYVAVGLILNVILTVVGVASFGAIATVYASGISWAIGAIYFLFVIHREDLLPIAGTWRALRFLGVWILLLAVASVLAATVYIPLSRWGAFCRLLILTPASVSLWGLGCAAMILLDSGVRKDVANYTSALRRRFTVGSLPL